MKSSPTCYKNIFPSQQSKKQRKFHKIESSKSPRRTTSLCNSSRWNTQRGNNMKKDIITFEEYFQQKAIEKRDNEIIANMLQEHYSITSIEKCTKVPQDRINEIAKANNIPLP